MLDESFTVYTVLQLGSLLSCICLVLVCVCIGLGRTKHHHYEYLDLCDLYLAWGFDLRGCSDSELLELMLW